MIFKLNKKSYNYANTYVQNCRQFEVNMVQGVIHHIYNDDNILTILWYNQN